MYSAGLEAIIGIGMAKVILTGVGVSAGLAAIVFWIVMIVNENTFHTFSGAFIARFFSIVLPIICVASIVIYNLPTMREEIVIARVVAPVLDKYADTHPESIFNSDIILDETDKAIKGIVATTVELPGYIKKLASGGIPAILEKKPEDMSKEELIKKLNELTKNEK